MLKSQKKQCQICGTAFIGRVDKKFCSDGCRAVYHQNNKSADVTIVKEVNKILKLNRSLLVKLNPNGKSVVTKEALVKLGFNFNYYTNTITTKTGNVYYFCYEYGYLYGEDRKLVLVKSK